MAKAVNWRPLTVETDFQFQANSREIYGGKYFSVVSYTFEYIRCTHVVIISPTPHTH